MKKIITKFQKIAVKVLAILIVCLATLLNIIFINDVYGALAILMVGGGLIVLINELI